MSRHAAAVLMTSAQKRGVPCTILSLNDPLGNHTVQVAGVALILRGFDRQKSWFILDALAAASRDTLVYIGHRNIAPNGMPMKAMHPSLQYWVPTHGIDVWQPLSFLRCLALRVASRVTATTRYTAV